MKWSADEWFGVEDTNAGRVEAHVLFSDRLGDYAWNVHLHFEGGHARISGRADRVSEAKQKCSRAAKRIVKNPEKYLHEHR